mmetsp:Transcript_8785/g.12221  ORF Transcript_8785/g.12221 Transcript_8785/m.12221 type:complete len:231 (+) Transcript_8785:150-842(+)
MTSAYTGSPGDGRKGLEKLSKYLPLETTLSRTGDQISIGPFETVDDIAIGRDLMNQVIVEGKSWPFDKIFEDTQSFEGYFLSHAAFVVKSKDNNQILGCFYIKPNFPGRCSHICNGGFITTPKWRGKGVGRLMAVTFLHFAKLLGYRASYFNLVFASNKASVALWDSLGFERVASIPLCANLSGLDYLDTAYGYYFDLHSSTNPLPPFPKVTSGDSPSADFSTLRMHLNT